MEDLISHKSPLFGRRIALLEDVEDERLLYDLKEKVERFRIIGEGIFAKSFYKTTKVLNL
jgi:hypothetical protein